MRFRVCLNLSVLPTPHQLSLQSILIIYTFQRQVPCLLYQAPYGRCRWKGLEIANEQDFCLLLSLIIGLSVWNLNIFHTQSLPPCAWWGWYWRTIWVSWAVWEASWAVFMWEFHTDCFQQRPSLQDLDLGWEGFTPRYRQKPAASQNTLSSENPQHQHPGLCPDSSNTRANKINTSKYCTCKQEAA